MPSWNQPSLRTYTGQCSPHAVAARTSDHALPLQARSRKTNLAVLSFVRPCSVILSHGSLEAAMAFLLANKLADGVTLGSVQLMSLIRQVLTEDPEIMAAASADMHAVLDRDPACDK